MASNQPVAGMDKRRAILLTLFVVVAIGAAIHLASGSDEPAAMPDEFVDEDVVELSPLIPTGNMTSASWRTAEQVREDRAAEDLEAEEGGGDSIFDDVEWGEDEERREFDKTVEETVREIDGLGVYIAPPEKDKKDAGK